VSIYFDARFIRVGRHDGISRFAANLFGEVSKLMPITAIVSDAAQLNHLPPGCAHIFECAVDSPRELGFARRMNKRGAKVIFSPMQTTGAFGKKFKLILTIHDLIYYRFRTPPASMRPFVKAIWRLYHLTYWPQRWLLSSADAVVTVSQTTAELIKAHRLTEAQVQVVSNAVDESFRVPRESTIAKDFVRLIYMGRFMGYKDVETLVRASVLVNRAELHLVSAIEGARKAELEGLASRVGARVIFHNGLSDADYIELLDSAALVVSASRAEGFGIPVIEGFARGVPAVLTDIPVFREVAGHAAIYFAEGDSYSCAEAIAEALENRETLSASAVRRASEFSWAKSALDLVKVIESLS